MFRQEALDRLSSPEELDKLMHVTNPRLWLALGAIVGLLGAGVLWTVFTSIPSTVSAHGALVRSTTRGSVQPVVFATLQESTEIHSRQSATVSIQHPEGNGPHILDASVASVDPYPIDEQGMLKVLRVAGFAHSLAAQDKIIQVRLNLVPKKGSASGYQSKSGGSGAVKLAPGMIVTVSITIDHQSPIHLFIP